MVPTLYPQPAREEPLQNNGRTLTPTTSFSGCGGAPWGINSSQRVQEAQRIFSLDLWGGAGLEAACI